MAGIRNLRATGDTISVSLAADTNHAEGALPTGGDGLLVQNAGGYTAHILISNGSEVATKVCLPIIAGGIYVLRKALEANHYSVLANGGAVQLFLTPCESD